jgi:probable O-glycosylation ligase (exosortase A-associated)
MLRLVFVVLIIAAGTFFAIQSAFYGLLFYLWNAYFRPDDWTYSGVLIPFRLSLIIGIYVVLRTILSLPNPKLNARTGLILLFVGQAALGCVTSENPYWSWAFFEDFVKVLIITYLIVVLVNDRRQFRLAILVIAMSLGFETAKQGWVNLYRAPGAANSNQIVFLGDNNGVAIGTMMLLPLFGALAQTSAQRWQRFLHRFVAGGVLLRGISTYSRGGFLGAGALGVIVILRSQKKFRALLLVILVSGVFWSLMPDRFWNRMDTITVEEGQERDSSATGRLHFWQVAIAMAAEKPWTGVGLNGFNLSYPTYNTDPLFPGERAAHSSWFGMLGDLGYVGLALFVANIVMAFWSCWRVTRLARQHPPLLHLAIYANALIASLVVYCVSGSFVSFHYNEMIWHLFGLSTALHFIASHESQQLLAPLTDERKIA